MITPELAREVWERAEGKCEWVENGTRCNSTGDWRGLQNAHIIHRKMGGRHGKMKAVIDNKDNILLLCAYHHDLFDGRVRKEVIRDGDLLGSY